MTSRYNYEEGDMVMCIGRRYSSMKYGDRRKVLEFDGPEYKIRLSNPLSPTDSSWFNALWFQPSQSTLLALKARERKKYQFQREMKGQFQKYWKDAGYDTSGLYDYRQMQLDIDGGAYAMFGFDSAKGLDTTVVSVIHSDGTIHVKEITQTEKVNGTMLHIAVAITEGQHIDEVCGNAQKYGMKPANSDAGSAALPFLVDTSQSGLKQRIANEIRRRPDISWLILSGNTIGSSVPNVSYRSL